MSSTNEDQSTLSVDDIRRVLETLDASDWEEALITVGDVQIAVARNGGVLPTGGTTPAPVTAAPPAPAPAGAAAAAAPAPGAAPAPAAASAPVAPPASIGAEVTAPSVGVFWRAPEPAAPPFVEVGTHVSVGDTLGIVEVMKLMSHVDAPVAGTVTAIHAANAQSVEHGAALFTIAPDEG